MLATVSWEDLVEKNTLVLPISGWMGDNLLGVKPTCLGMSKMDCDTSGYIQPRYDEVANEMKGMLATVGWKEALVE